ncbi:MAG: zinc metallopeptidase [Tenericutes bacterium]|nr:zinc metallopeptidase [Mycoplasmatota bacterium]
MNENGILLNYMLYFLGILITIGAQIYIKVSYNKYKKESTKSNMTGFEVARKILDENGLQDIHVVETPGNLTDHYDPQRKVVRLSKEVFNGQTIASNSVAAHEVGHAIQDKEGYTYMKIRSTLVPFVNFCSKLGYIVLVIGFIASAFDIVYVGIILLATTLIFQLVTLPVEFNASKRAGIQLKKEDILNKEEQEGSKTMLTAAALTYVASLVTTLLEILRLFLAAKDRN